MEKNYACGKLIKQIHDELEKQANSALSAQNLTLTQMRVLMELEAAHGQRLSLKELESLLHVAQSTAAGIAMRLEQKGFVEGCADENDRRVKMVAITAAGLACCQNAASQVQEMEAWLLQGLAESEKMQLHALLEKVFRAF